MNSFNSNHLQNGSVNSNENHQKNSSSNLHNHLLICTNNVASTSNSSALSSSSATNNQIGPTSALRIIATSNGQTTPIGYITSPNVIFDYNASNSALSCSNPNSSQLAFLANNDHYSLVHVLPPSSQPTITLNDTPNLTVNNSHQTHNNLNINLNTNQFNTNFINLHHIHHHHHSHLHSMQQQHYLDANNNLSHEGKIFLNRIQ